MTQHSGDEARRRGHRVGPGFARGDSVSTEPAPTGQDDTADPVAVLRQRVLHADELLNTVSASTFVAEHDLTIAMDALIRATGKAYSASDPAVQAVARALIAPRAVSDGPEF